METRRAEVDIDPTVIERRSWKCIASNARKDRIMKALTQERLTTLDGSLLGKATGGENETSNVNTFRASGNLKLQLPMGSIEGNGEVTKTHTDFQGCLDSLTTRIDGLKSASDDKKMDLFMTGLGVCNATRKQP